MTASGSKSSAAIGFLTVMEHPQHGLFGGYLVLNSTGRPLEFHCTAPTKPNRAQEILYGPTLRPYLFGEQIGYALWSKAKLKASCVLTDCEPVLALRDLVECPVVLIQQEEETQGLSLHTESANGLRDDHETAVPRGRSSDDEGAVAGRFVFPLGSVLASLPNRYSSDQQAVTDCWRECAETLDLLEPFDRIRDAIEEAQRMAA
jgi:hypothetical protein